MQSPFPGMDPYIEACGLWEDFHYSLIYEIKRARRRCSSSLRRSHGGAGLSCAHQGGRQGQPPLSSRRQCHHLSQPQEAREKRRHDCGGIGGGRDAACSPAFLEEEHNEAFVEIYETDPQLRLVTAIEVLSPSNKRPGTPGWRPLSAQATELVPGRR